MSLFVKLFSGGEKVGKRPSQPVEMEKLLEREELLMKKKEFLKKKIDQELLFAKKNNRNNRRAALQALRRKKWYENQLKYVDRAVEALRSAHEHTDVVNTVITDITEEHDQNQDMSDSLHALLSLGVEFDEYELLAELERLEKSLDGSVFEKNRWEDRVPCPMAPSPASPPRPAETEEDESEGDLEYLRRWATEPSRTCHRPQHKE